MASNLQFCTPLVVWSDSLLYFLLLLLQILTRSTPFHCVFLFWGTRSIYLPSYPISEVKTFLRLGENNKARSKDSISTNMLSHLPSNFILYFVIQIKCMLSLNIFHRLMVENSCCLPAETRWWQPRPRQLSPFLLLSCLSKFTDVLVNHRKRSFNSQYLFIPEQFDFRAGHSKPHQLWRVS